jgi:hypothetical protein
LIAATSLGNSEIWASLPWLVTFTYNYGKQRSLQGSAAHLLRRRSRKSQEAWSDFGGFPDHKIHKVFSTESVPGQKWARVLRSDTQQYKVLEQEDDPK